VLAYVRRFSRGDAQAEDLTQAFFEQLLLTRTHDAADPQRGRFRVFLLVTLKRFLIKQSVQANTIKRGGGQAVFSLDCEDECGAMAIDPDTPDAAFERGWAAVVVRQAVMRLQEEAAAANKLELFRALRGFLLESPEADDYAQLATGLGLRRNTLAVAIHRMRQRLRELVREELADTVAEAEQLENEVSALQEALGEPARRVESAS
jgi:RNA polymerase sigma-70 factor (ECF subfamily)